MQKQPSSERASFASLLFFTRAAVLRDPGLANARLADAFADWGVLLVNGCLSAKDTEDPPLALSALLRAWDDPAVFRPCPSCHAPMLFLHADGGGMLHWRFHIEWFCPLCEKTDRREICGLSNGEELLIPIRKAFRRIRHEAVDAPPGLPFNEALARLRDLRDADLLDPSHRLASEFIAQVPMALHALQDHPPGWVEANRRRSRLAAAVRDARIRAELATRERIADARVLLGDVLAQQEKDCAAAKAELAALRASRGGAGPRLRLQCGEISQEDYSAIVARKRELTAFLLPEHLAAERAAALARNLEKELNRTITADERRVFLDVVENTCPSTESL